MESLIVMNYKWTGIPIEKLSVKIFFRGDAFLSKASLLFKENQIIK